jgi:uncharacterized membrane protein
MSNINKALIIILCTCISMYFLGDSLLYANRSQLLSTLVAGFIFVTAQVGLFQAYLAHKELKNKISLSVLVLSILLDLLVVIISFYLVLSWF